MREANVDIELLNKTNQLETSLIDHQEREIKKKKITHKTRMKFIFMNLSPNIYDSKSCGL